MTAPPTPAHVDQIDTLTTMQPPTARELAAPLRWHELACQGRPIPVAVDRPQCGFYLYTEGTGALLPAAIRWDADKAEWHATVMFERVPIEWLWPQVAPLAIPRQIYATALNAVYAPYADWRDRHALAEIEKEWTDTK